MKPGNLLLNVWVRTGSCQGHTSGSLACAGQPEAIVQLVFPSRRAIVVAAAAAFLAGLPLPIHLAMALLVHAASYAWRR
jgi:hypothetical protein